MKYGIFIRMAKRMIAGGRDILGEASISSKGGSYVITNQNKLMRQNYIYYWRRSHEK